MTLAAAPNLTVFAGDGVTTTIPFSFAINTTDGSDIQVYYVDADGTVTLLTSNYSVNVNTNQVIYPSVGGVFPLESNENALPVGDSLVLLRTEPLSQLLSLSGGQGAVTLASIEAEFDKVTMILQQLQEQLNRCVQYPVGSSPSAQTVSAFVAAFSAIAIQPILTGTFAYLVATTASSAPTVPRFGIASDLGSGNALMWYCGNPTYGNQGWFGPLAGS